MAQANPARIAVNCSECGQAAGYVASSQVAKAQAFSPWRGWALGSVLSQAATLLSLRCPSCEQDKAPRPSPAPHPNLGL